MSSWTRMLVATTALSLAVIPTPAVAAEPDGISDPGLRVCIAGKLGVKPAAEFTAEQLGGISSLNCDSEKTGPIDELTGIDRLTGLENLTLWHQKLGDLTALDGLPITTFLFYRSSLTGVTAPLDLPRLDTLSLRGSQVPDLAFLADLPAINRVDLVATTFPSLAPFAALPPLEEMYLGGNGDADLTGLAEMSVESLGVTETKATSLPQLGRSPALKRLRIAGEHLVDLNSLAGWSTLSELDLLTPPLTDLSGLSGLTGLTVLKSYRSLPDLRAVAGLKNLTTLVAPGPGLADLSPLRGLTELKLLYLDHNEITDLSPLAGLGKLQTLSLNANEITSAAALAGLTELTELGLEGNQVRDLSPLAGLTKLTTLSLRGNTIADLRPLARLTNLTALNLSSNTIEDLNALNGLSKLESVNLSVNWIKDVRPLAALPKSVDLDLSRNHIIDLSPLAGHTGKIRASHQYRYLDEATFGTAYPVKIAGIDGSTPTLRFSEGASYRDGKLRYTIAGPNQVWFSTGGDPETAFGGEIRQDVGPDQYFSKPKLRVRGRSVVGAAVTASYTGSWKPAPTSLRYQWYRGSREIPGATEQKYRVTSKDVGHRLRVRAIAYRPGYRYGWVWSDYTAKARRAEFATAARPRISGVVKTGEKLAVTVPERDPAATKVSYQWYRNSKKISKATKSSYTLTAADKGKRISVRVTYQAPGIETERVYSKKTAKVAAGPVRSATPTISGTVAVGERLTARAGSWGPGTVKLKYQWRRDGKAIKGATSRAYRVTTKDAGGQLTVAVTGSRKGYKSVTRVSAAVAVPG